MSYLTVADYIARFTLPEALRVAQDGQTGTVDQAKVQKVIDDATLFANAYLASRYALPIDPAPELLRKAVADLSREALHTTRPTDAVTLAADRARSLLKDLQAGRASLPTPAAGEAPVENPDALPAVSNDRRPRVFSDSALADFTAIGGGRYGGTVFDGPAGW